MRMLGGRDSWEEGWREGRMCASWEEGGGWVLGVGY